MIPREFKFTQDDFRVVCRLIHDYAGIALNESKREMVYGRLAKRLRAIGVTTFAEYLSRLKKSSTEWEFFVNALTTNLTSFFREPHHFPILAHHLKSKPHAVAWCSACSTGEEAYSIAMTVVNTLGSFNTSVKIIASDLDTQVLQTAKQGYYSLESVSHLPKSQVDKFFTRADNGWLGGVQVRPELQQMVRFQRINLLDAAYPVREPLDVIFCRNVMIYFDKPTQLEVLKKFSGLLRKDGLLFSGHSESFSHASAYFQLNGNTVYGLTEKSRVPAS